MGVDPAYAPFEFMDQSGRYAGMSADYMKLITKHLGVEMEIPPDIRWDTVLNKLKTRDLDVSPALLQTDERKEYLLFTQPYIKYSIAVVTRHDHSNVELLSSLAGKKGGFDQNLRLFLHGPKDGTPHHSCLCGYDFRRP